MEKESEIRAQSCQQLNDERITAKDAEIARLREALENIAYAKTWIILNKPMELVKIAIKALEATND
jgi:hypothetical protein